MVDEPEQVRNGPGQAIKRTLLVVDYVGVVTGVALVVAAWRAGDPPGWWLPVGIPLILVFGTLATIGTAFRLRYPDPEQRREYLARLEARRAEVGRPLDRSKLAHRASRHKKAVLRSGADATAVVTFLADGHRANEYQQLVYLELEVQLPDRQPYQVKTGEYLNAASAGSVAPGRQLQVRVDRQDPQRVAVDWERSLRLK